MRRFSQLSVEDLERRAASHPEDVADIIVELENHRTTRVAQHLLADLRAHQKGNPGYSELTIRAMLGHASRGVTQR